jgi:hypothetical protein
LRHYCTRTRRMVTGSIPDDVIAIFNLPNTSSRIMALVSTQAFNTNEYQESSWGKVFRIRPTWAYQGKSDCDRGCRAPVHDFPHLHSVQTGSVAHRASYTMGTGRMFHPGIKRLGSEADHSSPFNAEVTFIPPRVLIARCLIN